MPIAGFLNRYAVIRRLKNRRNAAIDRMFRGRAAETGHELAAKLSADGVTFPCFVIAFNTPWVVDLLIAGWQRHCTGAHLVVLDNSSDAGAAQAIRRICEERGVPYLELPANPEWSPNRSHGISMNWAYYNIVRRMQPDAFGFIDHDCIPIAQHDFSAMLSGYSVYGRPNRTQTEKWNLWAGYCFFRYADTEGRKIDFKHRIEWLLDTGGGNWEPLYSTLDPAAVGWADTQDKPDPSGPPGSVGQFIDGSFLHIGGASYRKAVAEEVALRGLPERMWETYLPDCRPVLEAGKPPAEGAGRQSPGQ